MSDTRRAALEAAFDEHEEVANNEERQNEPTVVDTTQTPANDNVVDEPNVIDEPVVKTTTEPRAKDPATGKFLPKDGEKDGTKPLSKNARQVQEAQVTQQTTSKAPQSWKPEIREKFSSLPPEVQAEVNRRETEISNGFRQIQDVRNYATSLQKVIQPYEALIRAEGGNHVTAVDNMMKTAYILRTAPPQQKATLVAQMILHHNVDLGMLDKILDNVVNKGQTFQGQQAPQRNDPNMQFIQQELAPIKQMFNQLQGRMSQSDDQMTQNLIQEMQAFESDPKYEFYHDVKADMATFLDIAAQRGVKMTLQEAYQRATLAHPTISQTMISRQMQTRAAQQTAATRRARNASASLPSGGAPAGDQQNRPTDRRSAIEAAWDEVEERQ